MKVTLTASTGAKILVWRQDDVFSARRAGSAEPAQVCLPVDLFEVIAELAELDLESAAGAAEATELAARAQKQIDASAQEERPSLQCNPEAGSGPS